MNAELLAEFVRKNQGFPLYPLRAGSRHFADLGADAEHIAVVTQPRSPMGAG